MSSTTCAWLVSPIALTAYSTVVLPMVTALRIASGDYRYLRERDIHGVFDSRESVTGVPLLRLVRRAVKILSYHKTLGVAPSGFKSGVPAIKHAPRPTSRRGT